MHLRIRPPAEAATPSTALSGRLCNHVLFLDHRMMARAALAGSLAGLRLACLGSQPYNDTA